jgi:ferric-dicitrate binding protein FerR (iron transport regulator)
MNIHTSKGVVVKVLGTTFDLSAYDNDDNIKLTLIEGKVVVREEKTGSEHEVRPNQQISIASRTGELDKPLPRPVIKRANIQQNTGWVNGELIFNNTAMPEIVKQLERWYGVHVHIVDKEILDYRLTATFTTESITRVLDLIKFSSMLQYEINGTDVYIRKI